MFRAIALVAAGIVLILLLAAGLTVRMAPPASPGWKEFSIGPASGRSATINPGVLRADGVSLLTALSMVYAIPAVRIVAPPWVGHTRYAITAVAPEEDRELFNRLFQEEMKARFDLVTHREQRAFDVFVLSAGSVHDLQDGRKEETGTRIGDDRAELRGGSMERLAGALQSILGKPVVNDTGIAGQFHMEFAWGENRVATVTETLRRKFGLELTPARREMDALVVDRIQPDSALSIFRHVEHLIGHAPAGVRRSISNALSIR